MRAPAFAILAVVLAGLAFARAGDAAKPSTPPPTPAATTPPPTTSGPAAAKAPPVSALPPMPVVARPAPAQPAVGVPSDTHLDRTPPRITKGLDLVKLGWTYNCMECHKLLQARWHYDRPMAEHEGIKLDHGDNRFCLNCHHPTNRNAFVDYDGSEIQEADVFLLCAKCHGPTYRDWKAGAHGRRNGYWDTAKGSQTRLRCIECHDPHSPKFAPLHPLAPLRYPDRAAYPPSAPPEHASVPTAAHPRPRPDMNPDPHSADVSPKTIEEVYQPVTRRTFLRGSAGALAGMAGLVAALRPLLALERGEITLDDLLQKHYRELTPADLERILRNLETECEREHGVRPTIRDLKPIDGVQFAYALNLSRCVGCRKCAHACLAENNQSRDSATDIEMSYIRVLELDQGAINLESSSPYYDADKVPRPGKYYMPVQCHQCRESPCTKVCPVQATWQEPDGIVTVDYNWCIGCRYCMAACPYDARRFNYHKPTVPKAAINPNQSYLSNRIRPKGVVEKCTFCLHRTRDGRYPACLEVCPTGARVFGNLLDPESEISYVLKNKRVYVLKEDVGTRPRFYYFFDK